MSCFLNHGFVEHLRESNVIVFLLHPVIGLENLRDRSKEEKKSQ